MDAVTIVTTFAALGGSLAFVGWPLAHPALAEDRESARTKRRGALDEEKERLLALLHDLEHDFATGKLEEADYQTLSARLKVDAAKVLKEIDVNEGRKLMRSDDALEPAAPSAVAKPSVDAPPRVEKPASADKPTRPGVKPNLDADDLAARFCTKCGRKAKNADDRFCGKCGNALPDPDDE